MPKSGESASIFPADFQIMTREANDDRESRLKKCSNRGVFPYAKKNTASERIAVPSIMPRVFGVKCRRADSKKSRAIQMASHAEKECVRNRRKKIREEKENQKAVLFIRKKYQERRKTGVRNMARAFGELNVLSNRPS